MPPEREPCPFLECDDCRCDRRLQLTRLPEAFCFCVTRYAACTIYQQIRREQKDPPHACELATIA